MNLLEYERIRVAQGPLDNSTRIKIVLYNKRQSEIGTFGDNADPGHREHLEKMNSKGKVGESSVLLEGDGTVVVLVGVGDTEDDEAAMRSNAAKAGATAYKRVSSLDRIEVSLGSSVHAYEVTVGVVLSSYEYSFLKKQEGDPKALSFISDAAEITRGIMVGNAQNFARFLADTPANLMHPSYFVEYARSYLREREGITLQAYDEAFMKINGMNLLLSVAQGSAQPPRLLTVQYRGREGEEVDLALVGKGVTFDSGGISLKPPAGMTDMKGDMLGAASVLSTIGLASETGLPINIDLVVPLVENLPSGTATKPGDVHVGMSGKSVEIDNTDAEGRLILADALAYAQRSNPRYIVDVATLTGAMSVALGDAFIGLFTRCDKFSEMIVRCGREANDSVWRMPLSSSYRPLMNSTVADIKNAGGRAGGSATAAIFLSEFVDKKIPWAHLDIAGVMCNHSNKAVYGSGMTGISVPLLIHIAKELSNIK
jgi:cytosol aminopeptidase